MTNMKRTRTLRRALRAETNPAPSGRGHVAIDRQDRTGYGDTRNAALVDLARRVQRKADTTGDR